MLNTFLAYWSCISGWAGWPVAGEALKLVPGLVLFPLTLLLTWKKFGHKALVSYSIRGGRTTASGMGDIVLTNCKDKPLIIHAIYTMTEEKVIFPIKDFSPPLVIKGLESASITGDIVSYYSDGRNEFKFAPDTIKEIHLITTGKTFKCKINKTPSTISIAAKNRYTLISKHTDCFMGVPYNSHVRYGVAYSMKGKTMTALIDQSGFINGDWPFPENMLKKEDIETAERIESLLNQRFGFAGITFHVTELNEAK